jgi:hypothetical protein
MAEPRPRNWKAMRADRVLAMAENRFGRRFASAEAAIAELSKLPVREQRAMKKVNVSKAERARRSGVSDRMIQGMSGANVGTAPSAAQSASRKLIVGMSKSRSALALAAVVGAGIVAASTGSQVMAAEKKRKQQGTSKNTVAAKQAEAAAKAAEADAERAKTETRRLELEARDRAADRADARREADKAPLEQLRQIGLVAAPLAAGMVYGAKKAAAIEAKVATAAEAKNRQLTAVAKKVRNSSNPARLKAGVRVADKLKLAKTKGPVGGVTAAFLVTEAVAARVVAANTDNETAREVLNGAAIGLGAAAVSTVGTRLVQRATSSVMPNAAAMVDVETARETLKKKAPAMAKAKGSLSKAVGRVALPVVAGITAVTAFSAAQSDAQAAGKDDGEARAEGSTAAAKSLTDLLTFGAGEATQKALAEGKSRGEAVASGLAVGAINTATFGVATMANDALADKGGVAGAITDTVSKAASKVGELLGWSDAAREASAEARADASGESTSPGMKALIGGIGTYAGGHFLELGLKARTPLSKGALITFGAAGLVSGFGLMAEALASVVSPAPEGKAFLNEGAERKAAQAPKAPVSTVVAASATPKKSDGQTAGYTRRSKTGASIQVGAYRTPDRR